MCPIRKSSVRTCARHLSATLRRGPRPTKDKKKKRWRGDRSPEITGSSPRREQEIHLLHGFLKSHQKQKPGKTIISSQVSIFHNSKFFLFFLRWSTPAPRSPFPTPPPPLSSLQSRGHPVQPVCLYPGRSPHCLPPYVPRAQQHSAHPRNVRDNVFKSIRGELGFFFFFLNGPSPRGPRLLLCSSLQLRHRGRIIYRVCKPKPCLA